MKRLNRYLKDTYRLRKRKEKQLLLNSYTQFILVKPKDITTLLINRSLFKAFRDPILIYLYNNYIYISTNYKVICRYYNKEYNQ